LKEQKVNSPPIEASLITDLKYLRQASKKTSRKEIEERNIVPLIKYALRKGWIQGYGLAAIQVGIPLAAAWYWLLKDEDSQRYAMGEGHLLINPRIIETLDLIINPGEGCLSIPGKTYTTKRYNKIVFINDDKECVAEGIEAQIIQHEIDHMHGILVTDREYVPNKIGRNVLCPCGSGKKYKKCCLKKEIP